MSEPKPRTERILVVDDEPAMRMALREVLRRSGWTVELAEHAEAGLERLEAGEDFDLLITDNRMPGMSGLDLVRKVRAMTPRLPIVMMTAFGTVEDAVTAMREGASDYLMKPFSFETVVEVVNRVLAVQGDAADMPAAAQPGHAIATTGPARSSSRSDSRAIIAESPMMKDVLELARDVADADATVLLNGESGTGKEVLARFVHEHSGRAGEFVAVNCAALPEGLLESELFGHEKGAFTGAVIARKGRFEQAQGGTLLLDEISEMPLALQAKLLRVLQEKEVSPVGGMQNLKLDVRIVATTNRDLESMVERGDFRQDLYYRLNVINLTLPPLRDRPADIARLTEYFLARYIRSNRPAARLSPEVGRWLRSYDWPGNVRELENMIERACLLARGEEITLDDLHLRPAERRMGRLGRSGADGERQPLNLDEPFTLEEMERRMIMSTLDKTGGNRTRTAEVLGVSVRTIRNKLSAYGLSEA